MTSYKTPRLPDALRAGSIIITCLSAFAGISFAQETNGSASVAPDDGDIVTLAEFSVKAEKEGSYIASESVTGSRVAEKIVNLPYSINVVTAEFIGDFGFLDLDDDFSYTSAFGNMDSGGSYTIRGFGATKALRNGFQRLGLIDRINVDRIEIIKGPSAAVYGETRPGGLVNIVTKKPKSRPGYRGSITFGSYSTFRAEIEATGPLSKSGKTAYIFNAAYMDNGMYGQGPAKTRQKSLSGAVSHKFSEKTSILIEIENMNRDADNTTSLPFTNDGTKAATQRRTRLATEMIGFNANTNSYTNREITAINATLEQRISQVWSARAAANIFNRNYTTYTHGGDAYELTGANAGTYGSRQPTFGRIYEDGGGAQVDVLAKYFLFGRTLENKTLITFDYSSYYRQDPQYRLPASGPGSVADLVSKGLYAQRININKPNFGMPEYSLSTFPTINRWRDNQVDTLGGFIRHQTAAWHDKLIVAFGVRYDRINFHLQDKKAATQAGNAALTVYDNYSQTATTPNVGINFAIAKGLRGYVNYAKSFFPDSQNVSAGASEANKANEGGYGWDYGFKTSMFDEALSFTFGGFYVMRTNVSVDEYDANTGLVEKVKLGDTLSRGVELDANWRITKGLSATLGGAYVDSFVTYAGRDIDILGRQVTRTPKISGYATLRYAFNGKFKGLSANIGTTYTGETTPFSGGGITDTAATIGGVKNPYYQIIHSNDGQREITIPGYWAPRAGIRYRWKMARAEHTVSFNAANLFNQHYITSARRVVTPFNFTAAYEIKF